MTYFIFTLLFLLIVLFFYVLFWGDRLFPDKPKETQPILLETIANECWLRRERELEEKLASKSKAPIITLDPVESNPESPTPDKPGAPEVHPEPKAQSPAPQAPDPYVKNKRWKHQELDDFENNFLSQYKNIIAQSQHIIPLQKVMEILDRYGDQSSVVSLYDDDEYKIIGNLFDTLAEVSILQHSLNVTYELAKIIEESNSRDIKYSMGKYALMCLAHDIGKIRELHTCEYTTGNHPIISAGVMRGVIPPGTPARDEIINAIRNHHVRNTRNRTTRMLREADLRAREYEAEIVSVEKAIAIRDILSDEAESPPPGKNHFKSSLFETVDLSWVDWGAVISEVGKKINVANSRKWVTAITVNDGYTYIQPILINEILWKQAGEKSVHEFTVHSMKNKKITNAVTNTVGRYLRKQNVLSEHVRFPFVMRKFNLVDSADNIIRSKHYMPVDTEIFNIPLKELEDRKLCLDWLRKIKKAVPC